MKWTQVVVFNSNEPTAPYLIGRELNLRKLPGQKWENITIAIKVLYGLWLAYMFANHLDISKGQDQGHALSTVNILDISKDKNDFLIAIKQEAMSDLSIGHVKIKVRIMHVQTESGRQYLSDHLRILNKL